MSNAQTTHTEAIEAAYERGRRVGLATAALALAVIAYVNLLGIEKSLLAVAFAAAALRGVPLSMIIRARTWIAVALASVHAITVVVIVVVYADKIAALARHVIALYYSLS
jgi:hypothetical protein